MSQRSVTGASAVVLLPVNLKEKPGVGHERCSLRHPPVFMMSTPNGHVTARSFTHLPSVLECVILCAFLHDQICLCSSSIDVCMLACAFLWMSVHMSARGGRVEVTVLAHDNRRSKEPLVSALVLQSNCLQSKDLTLLPDAKGCEGWI